MIKILIVLLFFSIFAIVSVLSRIYSKYIISKIKPWSLFDHYPFNCEKCFTTWSMVAIYIIAGYFLNNWIFAILGSIVSIGNGIGIWLTDFERQ